MTGKHIIYRWWTAGRSIKSIAWQVQQEYGWSIEKAQAWVADAVYHYAAHQQALQARKARQIVQQGL